MNITKIMASVFGQKEDKTMCECKKNNDKTFIIRKATTPVKVGKVVTILHLKNGLAERGPEIIGTTSWYQHGRLPILYSSALDRYQSYINEWFRNEQAITTVENLTFRSSEVDHVEFSHDPDFTIDAPYETKEEQ